MRKLIILLILIPNLVAGYDVDDLLLADKDIYAIGNCIGSYNFIKNEAKARKMEVVLIKTLAEKMNKIPDPPDKELTTTYMRISLKQHRTFNKNIALIAKNEGNEVAAYAINELIDICNMHY
jgi:hypothetical protein